MTIDEVKVPDFIEAEELERVLAFLDNLRESSTCNMFEAPRFLSSEFFGYSKQQYRDLVQYWMDTFTERSRGQK